MKIYTEEQVRKAIKLSLLNAKMFIHKGLGDDEYFPTVDDGINTITPIELPSDEEIRKESNKWVLGSQVWEKGAIWMKEKILNQNK